MNQSNQDAFYYSFSTVKNPTFTTELYSNHQ